MKIIHIVWNFNTGGIEIMLANIANEQVKSNYVKIIVINKITDRSVANRINKNIELIELNRVPKSKNPFPIIKMNLKLLFAKNSVIHIHKLNLCKYILPILKKRICVSIHHSIKNLDLKEKNELKVGRKIFTLSKIAQKQLLNLGFDSTVVQNGISLNSIKQKNAVSLDKIKRIVQIGRLDHLVKGQHLLILSADKLIEKGINNFSIDFIGEGKSELYLKKLTAEHSLEKYINFLGNKEQGYIFEHLCDYDLLAQPSFAEAFSLTILESMVAKVPVICTDIPELSERTGNGKFGILFKSGDIEDLTEKIKNSLFENENKDMVNLAYENALSYSVEITAKKYLEEYKQL